MQIHQQIEDLGLDGHVQGGHRLVGHHEPGLGDEGAGDADALALTAGKLVGIALQLLLRQADGAGDPRHLLVQLGLCQAEMGPERLLQQLPHGHAGIQGGVGVLKDELHVPALLPHSLPVQRTQVLTIEKDLPGGGLDEPQNGPARGRFAAAGFAHQAEGLLLPDLEGDVLHRVDIAHCFPHDAALDGKVGPQILDVQDYVVFAHTAASSRPPAWSQQRHRCPGETSVSPGTRSRQRGMQCSQRSANRQPGPKWPAVGTVPWMV